MARSGLSSVARFLSERIGVESVKKEWQKPELVVLVRTKPEEAVLDVCKRNDGSGVGHSNCTPDYQQGVGGCAKDNLS